MQCGCETLLVLNATQFFLTAYSGTHVRENLQKTRHCFKHRDKNVEVSAFVLLRENKIDRKADTIDHLAAPTTSRPFTAALPASILIRVYSSTSSPWVLMKAHESTPNALSTWFRKYKPWQHVSAVVVWMFMREYGGAIGADVHSCPGISYWPQPQTASTRRTLRFTRQAATVPCGNLV